MGKKLMGSVLLVAVLCTLYFAPAAGARSEPCAGDMRGKCLIRPHHLFTGAHTWVRGIHWAHWGQHGALGYGRLVERSIYASFTARAKIRLRLPAECEGREWFFSTTMKWGKGYKRPYLRGDNLTPCN